MKMPKDTSPYVDSKSSKAKVLGRLSKWEKSERRASFGVVVEDKMINGVEVRTMRVERHYNEPVAVGEPRPLNNEYTNKVDFIKCVSETVEGILSEL